MRRRKSLIGSNMIADLDGLRNHPRYQEILELIEQT